MPHPTPSAAPAPTKAELARAFIDKLASTLDPDFPSVFAVDNLAPAIEDESGIYGSEHGGVPPFVAADNAGWGR